MARAAVICQHNGSLGWPCLPCAAPEIDPQRHSLTTAHSTGDVSELGNGIRKRRPYDRHAPASSLGVIMRMDILN